MTRMPATLGLLTVLVALAATATALAQGGEDRSRTADDAPEVRIERAPPRPEDQRRLEHLRAWRDIYRARLAATRGAAENLFTELESRSLSALGHRCRELVARVAEIDRTGLFGSGDVELDRMVFGALERFRVGASDCLAGRFLSSYKLLLEAHTGLEWADERVAWLLRPPVRLRGLSPPG